MFAITLTAEEFACLQQYRPEILDVLKDTPSQGDDFLTHILAAKQVQEIARLTRSKKTMKVWNQFPYSLRLKLHGLHQKNYSVWGKKHTVNWKHYVNFKHKILVDHELRILNEPA